MWRIPVGFFPLVSFPGKVVVVRGRDSTQFSHGAYWAGSNVQTLLFGSEAGWERALAPPDRHPRVRSNKASGHSIGCVNSISHRANRLQTISGGGQTHGCRSRSWNVAASYIYKGTSSRACCKNDGGAARRRSSVYSRTILESPLDLARCVSDTLLRRRRFRRPRPSTCLRGSRSVRLARAGQGHRR